MDPYIEPIYLSKNEDFLFVTGYSDWECDYAKFCIHYYSKAESKWTNTIHDECTLDSIDECILDSTDRYLIMFSCSSNSILICDLFSCDNIKFSISPTRTLFTVKSVCSVRNKEREKKVIFGYVRIETAKNEVPELPFYISKICVDYFCSETVAIVGHEGNQYALIDINCILR